MDDETGAARDRKSERKSQGTRRTSIRRRGRTRTNLWRIGRVDVAPGWAAIIAALIGLAGAVFIAVFINGDDTKPVSRVNTNPKGEILSPKNNEKVAPLLIVEGTLVGIPSENHVWVAVKVGDLLFPKEPEVPSKDQHWTVQVIERERPPGGTLDLILLMVDPTGNHDIQDWLDNPEKPGLRRIRGSVQLDVVRNLIMT